MIVVIDDERTLKEDYYTEGVEVIHLRTSQSAMAFFATYVTQWYTRPTGAVQPVTDIWFDHDLGEGSDNDADVVADFISLISKLNPYIFQEVKIKIHTQNPVGGLNLYRTLSDFDRRNTGVEAFI